jgi:hypothetical protein
MVNNNDKPLEELVDKAVTEGQEGTGREATARKIAAVDIGGNITYGLVVGAMLDYSAGLNAAGIIASRTYATAMNSVVGGPYGWWREKAFKVTNTNEDSGKVRKTLVDLLAFNSFQVPMYATAIAVGSLISEGSVDWEKVRDGATNLAVISPLIGPTMGWYLDRFRRLFGVKSAAEGAYKGGKPDAS